MSAQPNYGPDYRASMAGARLQWDKLSPTMQDALSCAYEKGGPITRVLEAAEPTSDALIRRGLAVKLGGPWTWLTPMGLLVREAGLAAQAEAAR